MRNKSTLRTFKTGDLEGNRFDFPGGLKIFIFPKDVHDCSGLLLVKYASQYYTSAPKNPPSRRILIKKFKSSFHRFPSLPFYWGKPKRFCKTVLMNSVLCAATDEQIRHVDIFFSNYYNLQSVHFE